MNYTTWIKANIPSLESASSAETYALIKKAKRFSTLILLLIRAACWVTLLQLFTSIGTPLGIQLVTGTTGWILCIAAYFLLIIAMRPLENILVRKRLKQLSDAT